MPTITTRTRGSRARHGERRGDADARTASGDGVRPVKRRGRRSLSFPVVGAPAIAPRCSRVFERRLWSLGSRRALATGIDRDGLASRSTPRGMTVVPRAAPRDSADDPSAAPPSHAPHASSPRELWELSGRSSGSSVEHHARRRRRASPSSPRCPPRSPPERLSSAAWRSPRPPGARRPGARSSSSRSVPRRADPQAFEDGGVRQISRRDVRPRVPRRLDYAGDRLMSARDVAFERTRGLVRRGQNQAPAGRRGVSASMADARKPPRRGRAGPAA